MASTRKLTVPERLYPGFESLFKLEQPVVLELQRALAEAQPTLYLSDFAVEITAKIHSDSAKIEDILRTLATLYLVRTRNEVSISDFAEDVCTSLEAQNNSDLKPKDGNWNLFKEQLIRLLQCESSLGITAKAFDVMNEHEHSFCSAGTRILTDVRPIFSDDVSQEPPAVVIVHTLKIAYHEGEDTKEIFIAFDPKDIKELRQLLDKADKKAKSLLSALRCTKMLYLASDECRLSWFSVSPVTVTERHPLEDVIGSLASDTWLEIVEEQKLSRQKEKARGSLK